MCLRWMVGFQFRCKAVRTVKCVAARDHLTGAVKYYTYQLLWFVIAGL